MSQRIIACLAVLVYSAGHGSVVALKQHEGRTGARFLADYPFRNVALPWEERVADLVKRLTLEEIQDQMAHGGRNGPAAAIKRLGIGQYQFDNECLRGDVDPPGYSTAFPQALGLAAAFSPDLIFRVAEATGVEVRGKHNDFTRQGNFSLHTGASCFAPVLNIMRDPRWGRNQETYGEDPYLTGVYAANFIRGLQGNDTRYARATGGCKHFDVHGGPEDIPVSRLSFDAKVTEADWRMTFLPAFRKCVEAGTYSLMCSYNKINGVPACANKKLLTDIVRTEWNFTGYIVSDGGALGFIIDRHHYFNNTVDTAAACINAGCNLESNPRNSVFDSIVNATQEGKLTESRVRQMVAPLFYTRMRLGEFDPPEMNPYSKLSSGEVESRDHKTLAVEAAMKSSVLLKNNGVLPLNKTILLGTVGVVGPMANDSSQLFGDYSPTPPSQDVLTPLQGLRSISRSLKYAAGCNDTKCLTYNADDVSNAVSNTQINFVLLGTGQANEAEGLDRPDLELPGQQKALLLDILDNCSQSSPIVLLLFNAGPLNITFADQHPCVAAILECFFPAQAAGEALRHVLLSDVKGAVPAGRLPFTWPLLASQAGEALTGNIYLDNLGDMEADEVVQVYIQWTNSTLPAPQLQLAWFTRITMAARQTNLQVPFQIEGQTMALWVNDSWRIAAGTMNLYAGGQQPTQARAVPSNVIGGQFQIIGSKILGRF